MHSKANKPSILRSVSAALLLLVCAACQTVTTDSFSSRQVQTLEEAGFVEQPDGRYLLGISDRLLFHFDSSELQPGKAAILQDVATTLRAIGLEGAQIVGHTDDQGPDAYNLGLSQRRATAVKEMLVQLGLSEGRTRAAGAGETDPIESNETDAGRAQNRRVEVIVGPEDLISE